MTRATTAFGYRMGYDNNGNIISAAKGSETWAFNWSGFDKPRWMSDTGKGNAFLYGADHMRRVHLNFNAFSGNTATGAPTHYTEKKLYVANGEMEVDYKNASTSGESWSLDTVRVYIPGSDGRAGAAELKPTATAASQHRFLVYHYDHLGSIQTITNWGAATLSTESDSSRKSLFSYEPWGMNRNPVSWLGEASNQTTYSAGNGTDSTPRGFTGHEMLEGPFVHMNGRIYSPILSRFMSADPHIQNPINLQNYNRYSYVLNNPLKYTDPTGYDYLAMMSWGYQDPALAYAVGGEDAMQTAINLNLDRAETQAMVGIAAAPVGVSMLPGVGEAMDGALAYFGTEEDRVFIAASLMLNAETGGWAPNYAGVKAAAWSSRYMDDLRGLSRSVRAAETAAEEGKKVAKIEKAVEEIAKEAPVSNQLTNVQTINERNFYEGLFEAPIKGATRTSHRNYANKFLENSLETNSELKKLFDIELGEDVLGYMNSGTGKNLLNPPHTQWHHPVESIDIMQLLRKQEHTNPLLQDILHPGPNGTGGFGAYFKEPMK